MSTTTNGASPGPRKLKILMLHGYTQSGPLFHAKTRALEKNLEKAFPAAPKPGHLPTHPGGIELVYPTAPIHLSYSDIPGYDVDGAGAIDDSDSDAWAWWRRKGSCEPYRYEGIEQGLTQIAETITSSGPFDGVLGFSQGAAAAGMVAALLEPGRREAFEAAQAAGGMRFPEAFEADTGFVTDVVQAPLAFAVSYCGFAASNNAIYQAFYEPKITTPMLHFLGSVDTVVEESRSLRLVNACEHGSGVQGGVSRVVYHPGGHFVPSSQRQYVAALIAFLREVIGQGQKADGTRVSAEEKAEEMEMPF